jgi:hypothetical protein
MSSVYTLERLETALLARWGREEMTVYADYLQSIGDPRGEVIAIDLVNLDTVDESAWRERRHAVIATWLGESLADKLGSMIFQGFVQEAGSDETLLASPAGDFVRASRLGNDLSVIQRLVSRTRPWLTRLSITANAERSPNTSGPTLIDDKLAEQLAAAVPRLDELVLRGRGIMKRFSHPDVRQIRLDGPVLDALCWRGDWMKPPPTLAIDRVREPSPVADTRLYLSAEEDLAALAEPAIQRHVTHLRVPAATHLLSRALVALPRLAIVETTATGKPYDVLRGFVAKHQPRVELVLIER